MNPRVFRIMNAIARVFGVTAVVAGLATFALAEPPAVPAAQTAFSAPPSGDFYVKVAAATSLMGAVGAWLAPLIREGMATYRFRILEQSRLRELVRWADSAIRANPSLPPRPDIPMEWLADEPSATHVPITATTQPDPPPKP